VTSGPPLVTVVTICRNAENVVEATATSVLDQSYTAIEYLIIDGASTDGTVGVVEGIFERYPARTARCVSEPDDGIADAMNRGVLQSKGDIVVHLHAGDRFITRDAIERVVASFLQLHWRWAVANSVVIGPDGRTGHVYKPDADYRTLLKQNTIPHQSTFLVRDIFDRHGYFRTDLRIASDYEFWLRIAFSGGERYCVLPWDATYYLAGGGSARITELVPYLWTIRRDFRRAHGFPSLLSDLVFVSRIAVFWLVHERLSRR
jgi:glycosyltransferase involved in cell wall biosynthesis